MADARARRRLAQAAPAAALLALLACAQDRPPEAPVVDLAIAPIGSTDAAVETRSPPGAPPAAGDRVGITGRWEGVGQQDDGQTWDLVVEITSVGPGICARAEYPTVPCRAEWVCEGERAGVVRAHEHLLDDGALRCVDNGTMTMQLDGEGALDWRWSGQGQTARAKLRRSE